MEQKRKLYDKNGVGDRIRSRRQSLGISRTKIAEQIGKAEKYLSLIHICTEFDNPTRSPESGTDEEGNVTYTFAGEINNPAYGEPQNVNQIQITVHTDTAVSYTHLAGATTL